VSKQNENWTVGYQEVKNLIHNEMGITKDHMNVVIEKIVREQVGEVVGNSRQFIRQSIKEVIREEMENALLNEHYPEMRRNTYFHDKNARNPFNKFVSQIMKEEIIEMLRTQFDVGLEIKHKETETV
jgi:hypothetical protein